MSSCEAELNATHEFIPTIFHCRSILEDLGFPQPPSFVHQDNEATIKLINRGQLYTGRSKHIEVRFFKAHELVTSGIIEIVQCPSPDMTADSLTKCKHSATEEPQLKSLCNDSV